MLLKNTSILEVREYKSRTFLCTLKSAHSPVAGDSPLRRLQCNDWKRLDVELARILDVIFEKDCELNKVEEFELDADVRVKVRQSCTSVDTLLLCIDDAQYKKKDISLALECVLEHIDAKRASERNDDDVSECYGWAESVSEYNPHSPAGESYIPYKPSTTSKPADALAEDRYSPSPLLEPSPELPTYTPSPIKRTAKSDTELNTSGSDVANTQPKKDTTRRNCRLKSAPGLHNDLNFDLSPTISPYKKDSSDIEDASCEKDATKRIKLSRLKKRRKTDSKTKSSPSAINNESPDIFVSPASGSIIEIPSSSEKQSQQATKPITVNDSDKLQPAHKVRKHAKKDQRTDSESPTDAKTVPEKRSKSDRQKSSKVVENEEKSKLSRVNETRSKTPCILPASDSVRRSARSPMKTKRLIEELMPKNSQKKSPAVISSKIKKQKNMEIFGSETDTDDFVADEPSTSSRNLPSTKSSSTIKRKLEKSCTQEKESMSKWLSKKSPVADRSKKLKAPIKGRRRLLDISTPSPKKVEAPLSLPSKEEMAERMNREKLQMEQNKKIQEMLQGLLNSKKPKKVKPLSMDDMSAEDLLSSFTKYKRELDNLFNKLKRNPNISSYNGINHYLVIDLINTQKQRHMMRKLSEEYEKNASGVSVYTKLFANVMMPEWLLCIFKEKFHLTHERAIQQLKDQSYADCESD